MIKVRFHYEEGDFTKDCDMITVPAAGESIRFIDGHTINDENYTGHYYTRRQFTVQEVVHHPEREEYQAYVILR